MLFGCVCWCPMVPWCQIFCCFSRFSFLTAKKSATVALNLSGLLAFSLVLSFCPSPTHTKMCPTHTHWNIKIQPTAQALSRPEKQICPFSYLIGCQRGEEGGQVWCIKWPCDSITRTTVLWWGGVSITLLPSKASINTHTHTHKRTCHSHTNTHSLHDTGEKGSGVIEVHSFAQAWNEVNINSDIVFYCFLLIYWITYWIFKYSWNNVEIYHQENKRN